MRNIGSTQSLKEQREFNRWLSSNTILGSILAIGMLQWLWLGPILQADPIKRWLLDQSLPRLSECRLEIVRILGPPTGVSLGEVYADRYP